MDYSALPVFDTAEVVVCGGGTAGAFAAYAAADEGADVLVVEQLSSLGGSATNGLVTPVMSTHIKGEKQCSYISRILADRLVAENGAEGNGSYFDPMMLRLTLETMCAEKGVRTLFYTTIADVIRVDGKITALVVCNKRGLGLIKARVFIDSTGDGDVCVRAGAEYTKGNPETGKNQPVSLRYIAGNIDYDAFGQFLREQVAETGKNLAAEYWQDHLYAACCNGEQWTLGAVFDKAIAAGDLLPEDRAYWQIFTVPGRPGCLAFNTPEFFEHTDGTDPADLSFIQAEGKKRIIRQMKFYKKYFRGFENAYICEIASQVGVRESRNITTEYVLTASDLLSRAKFADMFCQSNYPVDIHGKSLNFGKIKVTPNEDGKNWYEIPYRSLVVKGIDNLFVAGRCLGAEFLAQSSLRVQHSVRSSGEAAGIAAAMCVRGNVLPRLLDGAAVREVMISKGAEYTE